MYINAGKIKKSFHKLKKIIANKLGIFNIKLFNFYF